MNQRHAVPACDSPRPVAQQAIELKGGPHAVLLFDGPQLLLNELIELIEVSPLICPNCRSSGVVTALSTACAFAPV